MKKINVMSLVFYWFYHKITKNILLWAILPYFFRKQMLSEKLVKKLKS